MKSLFVFLSVLFLTAYVNSQRLVRESTVTIKVVDGKFLVSGLIDRAPGSIDVLTRKIKAILPTDKNAINIETDYGVRSFPTGWESSFEKVLTTVKDWHSGIYTFKRDRQPEMRAAVSKLLETRYAPYGDSTPQILVN